MRVCRCAALTLLFASLAACGDKSNPNSPSTQTTTTTRVIGVTGNLAFGDVFVGARRDLTMVVSNTGNAALTVTGMTVTGGLSAHVVSNWTSGVVAPGGSQTVTISFEPVAAGSFSGTLTVNADQTSGTNSIGISGTALPTASFTGNWNGTYVVQQCNGTGSIQDLLCSANRGTFPVGTTLPIAMDLTQNGNSVTGTLSLGQVRGNVSGFVNSSGVLTLQGTATSGQLTAQISGWSTRVVGGNQMEGDFSYNATVVGTPGVAVVVNRLVRVVK
jgi:hypothetical protein